MSGADIQPDGRNARRIIRKGAADAIKTYHRATGGVFPAQVLQIVQEISKMGATPLVVSENTEVLGVIHLKDIVKGGIKERFAHLRRMGIKTVMITGDNHAHSDCHRGRGRRR